MLLVTLHCFKTNKGNETIKTNVVNIILNNETISEIIIASVKEIAKMYLS